LLPDTGIIDVRIPALRSRLTCAPDPTNGSCTQRESQGLWCGSDSSCLFGEVYADATATDKDCFLRFPTRIIGAPPPNDPTHAILYAKKSQNRTSTIYHYIYCDATIEKVDIDTELQIPSLLIDPDTPPRVVECSTRTPFATYGNSFLLFAEVSSLLLRPDPSYSNAFLETITKGVNGVQLSDNFDPDVLTDRVNTVWGVLMA
jgi:hypothetical protein